MCEHLHPNTCVVRGHLNAAPALPSSAAAQMKRKLAVTSSAKMLAVHCLAERSEWKKDGESVKESREKEDIWFYTAKSFIYLCMLVQFCEICALALWVLSWGNKPWLTVFLLFNAAGKPNHQPVSPDRALRAISLSPMSPSQHFHPISTSRNALRCHNRCANTPKS